MLERTDRDARPTRPTLAAYRPWPRGCRNLAVQSCGSSHLFSRCSHEHSQRHRSLSLDGASPCGTRLGASGFICRTDDKHAVAVSEEGEPRSCRVEWASCTRVALRGKTGGISIQNLYTERRPGETLAPTRTEKKYHSNQNRKRLLRRREEACLHTHTWIDVHDKERGSRSTFIPGHVHAAVCSAPHARAATLRIPVSSVSCRAVGEKLSADMCTYVISFLFADQGGRSKTRGRVCWCITRRTDARDGSSSDIVPL